jgi:hypothetical protein
MTRTAKIWLIVVLVVAVLALCCVVTVAAAVFLAGVFNMDEITEVARGPGSPSVTFANYERIETGMTYDEVAAIFGSPGVRTAQIQVGGAWLEFYSWKAVEGGNATVTFKNGIVSTKNQNGLR